MHESSTAQLATGADAGRFRGLALLSRRSVSQTEGGGIRLTVARRMGSGALFRDLRDRVLLVNPTYKPVWEIPGGAIEVGESPRQACRRELHEELGLEIEPGRLLVFDWLPSESERPDGWMFVFDGGVLSEDAAAQIRLEEAELSEWRFVDVDDLESFLVDRMVRRIREAHRCAMNGLFADLEWGFVPEVASGAE